MVFDARTMSSSALLKFRTDLKFYFELHRRVSWMEKEVDGQNGAQNVNMCQRERRIFPSSKSILDVLALKATSVGCVWSG